MEYTILLRQFIQPISKTVFLAAWPLIPNFLTVCNNGGVPLIWLMPGQVPALQGFPGIVYISGGAIHSCG